MSLIAEDEMPKSLPDRNVVSWFSDYEPQTAKGMDRYLQALIKTGQKDKAQRLMRKWWKNALFKSHEQNRFLADYGSFIDSQTHKIRFGYLLQKRHYTNARTIGRLLGNGYPQLAEARIALAESKPGVDGLIRKVPDNLQGDPGLMLARLKWRRKRNNDFGALEIFHNMPPAEIIPNKSEWWNERNIMVRRMIDEKRYESAYLLCCQ